MTSNQYQQLTCNLREHVITNEGDFIPAGTPVHVAGWASDGKKITVRTTAYMWADNFDIGDIEAARGGGCVGSGLWIDVHPGNLMYSALEPAPYRCNDCGHTGGRSHYYVNTGAETLCVDCA